MENEEKAKAWLKKLGFDDNGYTYVYSGLDSYDIRADLKDAGFRFSQELMWHTDDPQNAYSLMCFPVHYTTVLELYTWGEGAFFPNVKEFIRSKIAKLNPIEESGGYVEPDGDGKVRAYVVCADIKEVDGMYGPQQVVTFQEIDGDGVLTWYTTSNFQFGIGDTFTIQGTFKKNSEYRGLKSTIVSRVKVIDQI